MNFIKTIRRYRRLSYLLLTIAVITVIYAAIYRKENIGTNDIIIKIINKNSDNKTFLQDVDIKDLLNKKLSYGLDGASLKHIDTYEIENVLEKDQTISSADVYIDARNRLVLKIIEREPIVRIMDKNGNTYYLDEQGAYIPTSKHYTARVPIATGYIPLYSKKEMLKEKTILKDIIEVAKYIRTNDFMNALIDQINIDDNADIILIPKLSKQKIIFGDASNIEAKFKKLKNFYQEGLSYVGWQKYSIINIKFKDQVICK
ncbi:MAG: hypothetical protein KBA06_01250 [Saprospiraceae bacterium]|nr:hypothetical protein [Saprospiraceae bacterium]